MLKNMWVIAILSSLAGLSAFAAPITEESTKNSLIIALKPEVSVEEGRRLIESQGLVISRELPSLKVFLAVAGPGSLQSSASALMATGKIKEVDHDVWLQWIESSPESFQQTPMPTVEKTVEWLPKLKLVFSPSKDGPGAGEAQWGVQRVNAPAAWPTNQGDGVKVCVVDTGIDPTVPDLQGQVAGGHNAVENGKPWVDDHFHGTHVAGIIAAKLDGKGVVGVAPRARLYAVKALTKDGQGTMFSIMEGMTWCAQNGMNVMNMSLGAQQEIPLLKVAIDQALQAGVAVIAAAGNGDGHGGPSPVGYPAAYPGVIAISALSQEDGITKWSSRGPQVAFIAPGDKVPSTVPLSHDPSGIKAYSGTSMATPHVSGLAALAVAQGARGAEGVKAALSRAARKLSGLSAEEQGLGVIDAGNLAR